MSFSTISTNLCGIPMTWQRVEEEQEDSTAYRVGFDHISRASFVSLTAAIADATDNFFISPFDNTSRGYRMYFTHPEKQIITVQCDKISTAKILQAFRNVITCGALSCLLGGISLGLQFSILSTKVKVGGYIGVALSVVALSHSINRFKTESLNFATCFIAVVETARVVRNAQTNQDREVKLSIPDYLDGFQFKEWKA